MSPTRVLFLAKNMSSVDHGNAKSAHDVVAALRQLGCDVRLPYLENDRSARARWLRWRQRAFARRGLLVVVNGLGSTRLLERVRSRLPAVTADVIVVRESPLHYQLRGDDVALPLAALSRFRHRVFVSSIARDKWVALGAPSERSHYIPNTLVDAALSRAPEPDPDLELLDQTRVNVLVVGSLQPRKAQDLVVDAVLASRALANQFRFVFVGATNGDFARALVERSAGCAALLFVGQKSHLYDWYERADLVLQPSRAEAMSRVMLESLKCGVPFVCSDIEGAGEVVRDGVDGLLFPVDDAAAMERQLLSLASDDDRRRALGQRGRERYLAVCDWPHYLERWRALLTQLSE